MNKIGGTVDVEYEPELGERRVGYRVVGEESGLDHVVDCQLKAIVLVQDETYLVASAQIARLDARDPESVGVEQRGIGELGQLGRYETCGIARGHTDAQISRPRRRRT